MGNVCQTQHYYTITRVYLFSPLSILTMHSTTITTAVVLATIYVVCAAEDHHKRAPSGFTGVRGKKSIPDSAYSTGNSDSDSIPELKAVDIVSDLGAVDKRAPSGFMGMRGKKPFSLWEGTYPDGVFKRAPSGFMGMRGKKDMEFANYDEYIKRAPSGFMGMRGKKDYDSSSSQLDKRAPMGFMGMRGKKDYDEIADEKRAPSGFFGMRGKKMPRQAGFFGMRGKKYPYQFRGKFVGVRGKKASPDDYYNVDLDTVGQELDLNQLMLLLTENEGESDIWNGNNEVGQYSQK
ncbi:tachykinin [Tribolium castaneum]|uniref:Tachykinin n=2 Tax=Tribolium castaneum TaxID=7070 RepID=A0A139WD30_TRICA|nr:tachykinin [Tribolium castaneum]